jgi:DNA-binding MarR family transcriptional regulator
MPATRDKTPLITGIIAALRAIDADMDRIDEIAAARLGVNRTDFRCLDILSRGGAITAGQLAVEAGLTTGAITALVDRLERSGYVRRVRDGDDRRRVLIEPTKRSQEIVWPLFEGLVTDATAVLSRFTAAELTTILRFLETNRNALRARIDRAR